MSMILYGYYRSSASYRVRIALNLKGLEYAQRSVHLLREGGEHHQPGYRALNPQGLVPTLVTPDGSLNQSSAIIEYLEESFPEPALLPIGRAERAAVRSLAQLIACEIHPLNNLRVLDYLWPDDTSSPERRSWYHHWLEQGLRAFERQLEQTGAGEKFCFGGRPGLADLFLIPQVYNAIRFDHPLGNYPRIERIYHHCIQLEPFLRAAPEVQPDAPEPAALNG